VELNRMEKWWVGVGGSAVRAVRVPIDVAVVSLGELLVIPSR